MSVSQSWRDLSVQVSVMSVSQDLLTEGFTPLLLNLLSICKAVHYKKKEKTNIMVQPQVIVDLLESESQKVIAGGGDSNCDCPCHTCDPHDFCDSCKSCYDCGMGQSSDTCDHCGCPHNPSPASTNTTSNKS